MKAIIVDTKKKIVYTKDINSVEEYFNVPSEQIETYQLKGETVSFLKKNNRNDTGLSYFPFKDKIIYSNKILFIKDKYVYGDENFLMMKGAFIDSATIRKQEEDRLRFNNRMYYKYAKK